MNFWSEELKEDIIDARKKVKKLRKEIADKDIDEKAAAVGKSAIEFVKDTWDDVENILFDITTKIYEEAYDLKEDLRDEARELGEELSETREKIREIRRDVTGGRIEDNTKEAIAKEDDKLDRIAKKMKK
jgi:hypothetical protein